MQEVDEEDEEAFETFMSKDTPARRTLADVIMEKIRDKKTEIESQMSGMLSKDFNPFQVQTPIMLHTYLVLCSVIFPIIILQP